MTAVLPATMPAATGPDTPPTCPTGVPGRPPADHDGLSDAQLLRRHGDGCDRSYGILVGRHERLLSWTLHRLHIDPGDRADILQEALLKVHRQAASFRGSGCAAAWLRTIVTNTALTHVRTVGRRHEDVDTGDDGLLDRLRRIPDTRAVDAGRTVQRLLIRDAVATLHPGLQATILLCDVHGLSMKDVSVRTGVPVGTVKSRLSRARRQLRTLLSEAGLAPTVIRTTGGHGG